MTTLDPAYCADGCGRLAETERPRSDGTTEQVCRPCRVAAYNATLNRILADLGEHSSNPREDR